MNDLTTTSAPMTLAETVDLAQHFAKSGFFKNATDTSKAVVQILAGRELGVGPMTAMTGIHIVNGKPVLSAGLVGAMVLRSGRYTYDVLESTDVVCRLAWFRGERRIGESAFTIDEAKRAGLMNKDTWKSYASDMLFSRALTRGARRFCPDVFLGSVYVADELEGTDGPHAPDVAPAPATNGNGRANGNGHAPHADVIDGHAVEVEAAPEFHATPLIDAMKEPGELSDVMAAIQKGYRDNPHARSGAWVKAIDKAADLCADLADVGVVETAYHKAKARMVAGDVSKAETALSAARFAIAEQAAVIAENAVDAGVLV